MGSKGSAPKAPDYGALIPIQGGEDRRSLQYTLDQSRVNQQSPYGTQSWSKTPGQLDQAAFDAAMAKYNALSPKQKATAPMPTEDYYRGAPTWTYKQELSPEQQQLYDADTASKLTQAGLLGTAANRVEGTLGQPLDTSGLTQRRDIPQTGQQNNVADALYQQHMRFLAPEQDRQSERLRSQLLQSGFQEGSEGYTNESNRLDTQQQMVRADARDRALLASGAEDSRRFGQEAAATQMTEAQRDAMLREQMMLRNLPLNELNALRTGAQVNLPNNPAQYGSPQLASQDYIGAADKTYSAQMNAYNAQQAGLNSLLGGLFGMGGALLGTPAAGAAIFGG